MPDVGSLAVTLKANTAEYERKIRAAQKSAEKAAQSAARYADALKRGDSASSKAAKEARALASAENKQAAAAMKAANAQKRVVQATQKLSATQKRATKTTLSLSSAMGAMATAALGVGFVKVGAEFERAMVTVAAKTPEGQAALASLRKEALALASSTEYTGRKVAEGMNFLAQAGNDTNTIIGAMPAVLDLATAGAIELGDAADIVTNIMAGFSIGAEDLAGTANLIVQATTRANTNVIQLGEAFKLAGPIANAAGFSFKETTAALAMMGNAGFQATLAGTALRGAIARLANPAGKIKRTMDDLGISVHNADGSFKSMVEIVREFEPHAKNVGALMTIFGQRAGPAMAALLGQGSDALEKFINRLDATDDVMGRLREARLSTIAGQFDLIGGKAEAAAIKLNTATGPAVRALLRPLAGLLDVITDLDPAVASAVITVGGMAAAVKLLGVAMASFNANPMILGISAIAAAAIFASSEISKMIASAMQDQSKVVSGPRFVSMAEAMRISGGDDSGPLVTAAGMIGGGVQAASAGADRNVVGLSFNRAGVPTRMLDVGRGVDAAVKTIVENGVVKGFTAAGVDVTRVLSEYIPVAQKAHSAMQELNREREKEADRIRREAGELAESARAQIELDFMREIGRAKAFDIAAQKRVFGPGAVDVTPVPLGGITSEAAPIDWKKITSAAVSGVTAAFSRLAQYMRPAAAGVVRSMGDMVGSAAAAAEGSVSGAVDLFFTGATMLLDGFAAIGRESSDLVKNMQKATAAAASLARAQFFAAGMGGEGFESVLSREISRMFSGSRSALAAVAQSAIGGNFEDMFAWVDAFLRDPMAFLGGETGAPQALVDAFQRQVDSLVANEGLLDRAQTAYEQSLARTVLTQDRFNDLLAQGLEPLVDLESVLSMAEAEGVAATVLGALETALASALPDGITFDEFSSAIESLPPKMQEQLEQLAMQSAIFSEVADAGASAATALNDVASAIMNAPNGFKLALRRFQADVGEFFGVGVAQVATAAPGAVAPINFYGGVTFQAEDVHRIEDQVRQSARSGRFSRSGTTEPIGLPYGMSPRGGL